MKKLAFGLLFATSAALFVTTAQAAECGKLRCNNDATWPKTQKGWPVREGR